MDGGLVNQNKKGNTSVSKLILKSKTNRNNINNISIYNRNNKSENRDKGRTSSKTTNINLNKQPNFNRSFSVKKGKNSYNNKKEDLLLSENQEKSDLSKSSSNSKEKNKNNTLLDKANQIKQVLHNDTINATEQSNETTKINRNSKLKFNPIIKESTDENKIDKNKQSSKRMNNELRKNNKSNTNNSYFNNNTINTKYALPSIFNNSSANMIVKNLKFNNNKGSKQNINKNQLIELLDMKDIFKTQLEINDMIRLNTQN